MSKALNGEISKNSVKEIGWGEVFVRENEIGKIGLAKLQLLKVFIGLAKRFACRQRLFIYLQASFAII